jgi:hypothetical protein
MTKLLIGCIVALCIIASDGRAWAQAPKTTDVTTRYLGVGISVLHTAKGSLWLAATARWENAVLLERVVNLSTWNADTGTITNEQFDLAATDLVINPGLTKAVLRLPDGSVITWTATGDGSIANSDSTERSGLNRHRSITQIVSNEARAVGILNGTAIDTQEDPSVSSTIFRYHIREITHTVASR